MTCEQRQVAFARGRASAGARRCAAMGLVVALLSAASCASGEHFRSPTSLTSPYPESRREVVWAVAPLRNESGIEGVDGVKFAEALAAQITQVEGVRAIPVSRAIERLRELGLSAFEGAANARAVAEALGADGVIVGAITSYDPYDPPKIGVSLALHARSRAVRAPYKRDKEIDPNAIMGAISDRALTFVDAEDPEAPLSTAAAHFDGANHAVEIAVRGYANGRYEEGASPLGWRRYLASMTLFTEFAAHEMVARLLDAERIRLAQQAIAASLEQRR